MVANKMKKFIFVIFITIITIIISFCIPSPKEKNIVIFWEEEQTEEKAVTYDLFLSLNGKPFFKETSVEKMDLGGFLGAIWHGTLPSGTLLAAKVQGRGASGQAGPFSPSTEKLIE